MNGRVAAGAFPRERNRLGGKVKRQPSKGTVLGGANVGVVETLGKRHDDVFEAVVLHDKAKVGLLEAGLTHWNRVQVAAAPRAAIGEDYAHICGVVVKFVVVEMQDK